MFSLTSASHLALALAAAASLVACGSDDLQPDDVVGIPAGSGRGTAASGTYNVQFNVVTCEGNCQSPVNVCHLGDAGNGQFGVTQSEGRLTVNALGGTLVGGIDADGGFRVGALLPFRGLQAASRWDGESDSNSMSGDMTMHVTGNIEGVTVDCLTVATMVGTRAR